METRVRFQQLINRRLISWIDHLFGLSLPTNRLPKNSEFVVDFEPWLRGTARTWINGLFSGYEVYCMYVCGSDSYLAINTYIQTHTNTEYLHGAHCRRGSQQLYRRHFFFSTVVFVVALFTNIAYFICLFIWTKQISLLLHNAHNRHSLLPCNMTWR